MQLISEILSLPIRLLSHGPVLTRAFELASKHNLTVYDTLYLALAEERGSVTFSSDKKLLKSAALLRLR